MARKMLPIFQLRSIYIKGRNMNYFTYTSHQYLYCYRFSGHDMQNKINNGLRIGRTTLIQQYGSDKGVI